MNMLNDQYLSYMNEVRKGPSLLTVHELIEMQNSNKNIFLDPFSCVISKHVQLGFGNIFYPNITILSQDESKVEIGDKNVFFPQTSFRLAKAAKLNIHSGIQFGDGGVSIRLTSNHKVQIEDRSRLMGGVQILGPLNCGVGCQILGPIVVKNCTLESGKDAEEPNADLRGGVLKGFGIADAIHVPTGKVINGQGIFREDALQQQSFYHPLLPIEDAAS